MKTSDKQLVANRRNSKRSTGPKSLEGKNMVAKNAIKHGICADVLFVNPDGYGGQNEFQDTLLGLNQEWMPQGQTETNTIRKLAADYVRLNRVIRYEAALTQEALERYQSTPNDSLINYLEWGERVASILENFENDSIAALNCLFDLSNNDSEEMNPCRLRLAEKLNNLDSVTPEEKEKLRQSVFKMATHIRSEMGEKQKSLDKLDRAAFVNSFLIDKELDKILKYENSLERSIARNIEKLITLQNRRKKLGRLRNQTSITEPEISFNN